MNIPQDNRARQAGRARRAKQVGSSSVYVAPFSHSSHFTRHGPYTLADCFSILLMRLAPRVRER